MKERNSLSYVSIQPEKKKAKVERKNPFEAVALPEGARKEKTRVGRGRSAGRGKTCGRGQKGQKSRSGYSRRAGFEGGQMPLHRRLPKRGFRNIFRVEFQGVNLWRIEKAGGAGELNPEKMAELGLVSRPGDPIKVLGTGEIQSAIHVTADAFSESAKKKIEAAGGSCIVRELKKKAPASTTEAG